MTGLPAALAKTLWRAGDGHDLLRAGTGDDTLLGGAGDDALLGGAGDDTFIFDASHGDDVILDFDATGNGEKLDLSNIITIGVIGDLLDPRGAARQVGSDVLIDTGGGNSILLENVSLGGLDANDFIF